MAKCVGTSHERARWTPVIAMMMMMMMMMMIVRVVVMRTLMVGTSAKGIVF